MSQFHGYAKRLANIFDIDYPVVVSILPKTTLKIKKNKDLN